MSSKFKKEVGVGDGDLRMFPSNAGTMRTNEIFYVENVGKREMMA